MVRRRWFVTRISDRVQSNTHIVCICCSTRYVVCMWLTENTPSNICTEYFSSLVGSHCNILQKTTDQYNIYMVPILSRKFSSSISINRKRSHAMIENHKPLPRYSVNNTDLIFEIILFSSFPTSYCVSLLCYISRLYLS